MPRASELAELIVDGQIYKDWTSVMVRHEYGSPNPWRFQFTCSEPTPAPKVFPKLQLRPGNQVQVNLAGIPAIEGLIWQRQVFYNPTLHRIQLSGGNYVHKMALGSVTSKTNEWKNVNLEQIARAAAEQFGIQVSVEGGSLPEHKFERVASQTGETAWEFVERYTRPLGVYMGSNIGGGLVLYGALPLPGVDRVVEGDTQAPGGTGALILIGHEIIDNEALNNSDVIGQGTGNDNDWGAKVSHVPFFGSSIPLMPGLGRMPNLQFSEIPTSSIPTLRGRANFENKFSNTDFIYITVTVNGWQRPSDGALWHVGSKVTVWSPMMIMYDQELTLRCATFTQDDSGGSITELELVNDNALGMFDKGSDTAP